MSRAKELRKRLGERYSFKRMVSGQELFRLQKRPPEDFTEKLANGEFLEYTNYCNNYYGTLKQQIEDKVKAGKVVILVIEVEGAQNVKKVYPDCLTIFLAPPSLEELERRLKNRGTEDESKIKQRLFKAKEELGFQSSYDYIVENNFVEQCAESIISIYDNEK